MHICIDLHIPKYKFLRPYKVTCMYIFRAVCLALYSQLVWLRRLPSSSLLYSVACVGSKPPGRFLMPFGTFTGVRLVHLTFEQSYWWDGTRATSDPRRHNLTTKSLILWLLQYICLLFYNVIWALVMEVLDMSTGILIVVFCGGLFVTKRGSVLGGLKTTTICGFKDKMFTD